MLLMKLRLKMDHDYRKIGLTTTT